MMFLTAMIAVAVLGVAAVAATGRLDRMQPVVRDHVAPAEMTGGDPADADPRFSVRVRGYDMAEVDAYLEAREAAWRRGSALDHSGTDAE